MALPIEELSFFHVKLFLGLVRHRKSTIVAAEQGLSTSAVSRGLQQLRQALGDPLFVRTAQGMMPTSFAQSLVKDFLALEKSWQKLSDVGQSFDPKHAQGFFKILTYDEFAWAVHAVIMERIKPLAPRLQFHVQIMTDDCSNRLAQGEIDFAVVYEGFTGEGLLYEPFSYPEDLYLVLRREHPLCKMKTLTTRSLASYPLIEIDNPKDVERPLLQELCAEDGFHMPLMATISTLSAASFMLSQTDAVSLICNQFTRAFIHTIPTLTTLSLPAEMNQRLNRACSRERPMGNYLVYGSCQQSLGFQWVKQQLVEGLSARWQGLVNSL